ncbi:hypothetical protein A0J61_08972 [Choanephora cucurbitarum]|uniref:FIST domain-containing protein n=1 Tax=Choanephora cucurbitarum TaxID=101091 RepID=A0A1C7N2T8_9FUNG|nr:hypothetical protein A0J61_08972 [Choanephora cucurbitarum]
MSYLLSSVQRQLRFSRQTRSLWTKLTATGSSIEECVQVSVDSLKDLPSKPDVCFVLASKSFSLNNYRQLATDIQSHIKPTVFLGGVVDRVAQLDHGISLLLGYNEQIVPFTIEDSKDRHKVRSIAVGRWGRAEDRERLAYQSDHIDRIGLGNLDSISTPARAHQLPTGVDPEKKPSFVLTVSDHEPDHLFQAFDHYFPDIPKLGILGASTPFVTGEPYALFSQKKGMMGSGIVGFASYGQGQADVRIEHTAMQALGEPMKITRCRGNIILDLEEGGATGLLLRLIHGNKTGAQISKDEEFYLGVYPLNDDSEANMTVSRITSGDPSRGNMSVDTNVDLQVGQVVQFMRKTPSGFRNVANDPVKDQEFVLGVSSKDHTIDAAPVQIPEETTVLTDTFGGISENGIIVGRSNLPSEVLDVPFSKAIFKL